MSEFRVFLQQNLDVLFVILRALDAAEQDGGDVVVEIVVGSLLFHFENIDNFSLCLRENVRQSTMGWELNQRELSPHKEVGRGQARNHWLKDNSTLAA